MDRSSAHANSPDTHLNGGDWSPRISFSYNFACLQRVPSPTKTSSLHDSEFEFSRSFNSDLLSADELFCDGKLRPLKLSSRESGEREWEASPRREEVSACEEGSTSRWAQKCEGNAGEASLPTSREELISACREADVVGIGKKSVDLTSPPSKKEEPSSAGKSMAGKLEDFETPASRLRTSREGLLCVCNLEMGGKAGKSEAPTCSKEVISVRKLEMGENLGKSRSPIANLDEFMPAFKREKTSSKAEICKSREEDVAKLACKRVENSKLKGKLAREVNLPTTSRDDLLVACSASRSCEIGSTPVRWREEPLWAKRNEEDEHVNALSRRFSKHPRSASMLPEGSCKLGDRSCVSLNNSRCPSPSRSFSLPATMPASPTASSFISGFASSSFSSSSRYRSKIKDFFKLKKADVPKEDTLPTVSSSFSSTYRLPTSPRSFLAFFKSKESKKASGSKSSSSKHESCHKAQEHVCVSTKDVYGVASKDSFAKCKDFNALCLSQINPNIQEELGISCLTIPSSVKPLANSSSPHHFPLLSSTSSAASSSSSKVTIAASVSTEKTTKRSSSECLATSKPRAHKCSSFSHEKILGIEGTPRLVIGKGLWEEGNLKRSNIAPNEHTNGPLSKDGSEKIKKGNNMRVVGSKGEQQYVRTKGLERPLPYTSSVRVTPVINVPSCITPSLKKTKPPSKPKAFSFVNLNLFAKREKAWINPT